MRFEFIGGSLCLDFANTIHDSRAEDTEEELIEMADLLAWAREAALLSAAEHHRLAAYYAQHPRKAAAGLASATAVRDLVLDLFASVAQGRSPTPAQLRALNAALTRTPGVLRVANGGDHLDIRWSSAGDGLQRVRFAVLASAAELLASDRLRRVRECASADCTWLFVDETRNHSRRWCDMSTCGNRMKSRRHYARVRAATDGSPKVATAIIVRPAS